MAVNPTAHSLACLRIGVFVTADAARLATGVGGVTLHRTGFAPVGRQTKFHDITASSLPFDQPCLVAPCNNARPSTAWSTTSSGSAAIYFDRLTTACSEAERLSSGRW